jgi:hypothetical protein
VLDYAGARSTLGSAVAWSLGNQSVLAPSGTLSGNTRNDGSPVVDAIGLFRSKSGTTIAKQRRFLLRMVFRHERRINKHPRLRSAVSSQYRLKDADAAPGSKG